MDLPELQLVDLIFAKCMLVYGREFLARWEGQNIDEVKLDWARELGAVLSNPQAIKHALLHLPVERPPTVLQFRQLCVNHPVAPERRLNPPDPTPEEKQAVRSLLQQARDRITGNA